MTFAKEWLQFLKNTEQAEQIFATLDKIAKLEQRRDFYLTKFDVS